LSNSESTVLFTGIEICALHIVIFHQDQLCGFFKRRKNDFGWSSSNPFSEISFFEIIQMQVGKSVLLWRNASFQKHGNASLEISCEVWANLLVRRSSRGGNSSSSNFEISYHLQSLSAFVKNYPTSNFWWNIWPAISQLKHLTSNKCLLERPCIVNSKHLETST